MKVFLFISLVIFFNNEAIAQPSQYALVIGIDSYAPTNGKQAINASGRTEWPNLDGCKNDAQAMKNEIILRWGFKTDNIRELYDSAATRKNILEEINRLLLNCKKADVAFIFYAGHGSQVKNTKSPEQDKLDESIVPADACLAGVEDIRDKTLAALINKFIDKGIVLTTIFDCCHSGSLGRGFNDRPPKFRYIKMSNQDVSDDSAPPVPEFRKNGLYLAISASQENEPAQEQTDEHNLPHGAFTVALLKAINQQSVDAPVNNLFTATRAILKSNGKKQEPVLAGSSARLHGTLFGISPGVLPDKTLFPVISTGDSLIEIQGGFISGLNIDNELIKQGTDVRLKIVSMIGANRCAGRLISGDIKSIHPGELFEVSNWVSSSAPFLSLYIPASKLSFTEVEKIAVVCKQLKKSADIKWTNNYENEIADVNIYYSANQWMANSNNTVQLPVFSLANITKAASGKILAVNIPPFTELAASLKTVFFNQRNIRLTTDPNEAQYTLSGTLDENDQLSYRWIKSQTVADDSLGPLPIQTKIFAIQSTNQQSLEMVRDGLAESAGRLSKVRAWLNLQPPAAGGNFPFHLEIRNESLEKQLGENGITVGEKLSVYLRGDENYSSRWDRKKRFVYVFLIDRNGNMSLVYPEENSGNLNNRLPSLDAKDHPLSEQKLVEGVVTEPVGTDTYFLLTTDEPVPDYSYAFNQQGVRGNTAIKSDNPIAELINMTDPGARGFRKPIANNWTLQRIAVKTHH